MAETFNVTWLSSCHDAPTRNEGADEGTTWMICTKCGEPCNFYGATTRTWPPLEKKGDGAK